VTSPVTSPVTGPVLARLTAVAALALTLLAGPAATGGGPAAGATRTITLDGVSVSLRAGTRQVVTVNRTRGHHARVTLWAKTPRGWAVRERAHDGRIGYGGLVPRYERRQGTGTTPLGTFDLPSTFGRHTRGGSWDLPYRRIRRGDYWVQDNRSRYYNRYRNKAQGGFRWRLPSSDPNSSERLRDYPRQYEYAVVVKYNWSQVRHRGAGIFLHVNGSGATAGCVSAPRWFMREAMWRLQPARHPVIAIGR